MSSGKSKKKQQYAPGALLDDGPSTSGRGKESKSFMASFTKPAKPAQRKPQREEPVGNELARLLGNRQRALALFQDPGFSAEAFVAQYFQGLSEKGIDNARHDLGALLRSCAEEVEGVVYDHHQAFLEACQGVEDLEDKVALLRNCVNGMAALVATLKETRATVEQAVQAAGRAASGPSSAAAAGPAAPAAAADPPLSSRIAAIEDQMEGLVGDLEVAVAERRLEGALRVLRVCNDALAVLERDADVLSLEVADFPSWAHRFEAAIGARKQALTRALERQLSDAAAGREEVRASTRWLGALVGDSHAAGAMLHCYSQKLRALQAQVLRQHSSVGADPDVLEYAGSLMQESLLEVSRAADDLVIVFGVGSKDVAALFTVWAVREAKEAAVQLRRNVLTALAASATGLTPSMQCVSLALVFCCTLEQTHQISLTATVITELWPHVDGLLKRHLKRLAEELRWQASEEITSVVMQALSHTLPRITPGGPPKVTLPTAANIVAELSSLATALAPLAGPKLAGAMKRGVQEVFVGYTQAIGSALRGQLQASAEDLPLLQPLVPAVMEALAALIEEGLPDALAPLEALSGPVVDPKQLDKAINALYRECQQVKAGGAAGAAGKGGAGAAAAAAAGSGQ